MDGDRGQAGGAAYGFLAAIGVMVVLLAIFFSACFNSATGQQRGLGRVVLVGWHNDCRDDGYCGDGDGNGNSGGRYGGGHSGDQDDRDGRGNCRNFCNWTIPTPPLPGPGGGGQQPKGFLPPQPGKIPQQIADFVKVVSDFVQSVIKFAV